MPFKKGDPKPKGSGMKKGQKATKTKQWEEMGEWLVTEGADKYMEYLKKMDPDNYLKRFEAMLEYFKPKLSRAELTGKDGDDLNINIVNYDST
jgi:hypothetical protein